ncbi:MAG: hypothetical protein JO271_02200 [Verrucomicrobia bacterium]|nr:hypothetical protein [Verrucomicrobiota bacterium]
MESQKSLQDKPQGVMGRLVPMIVLLLVILGIAYLIWKPEPFINLMKYAQAQSQGKTLAEVNASASASALAAVSPSPATPEQYLDLMSMDVSKLSDQQKAVVGVFNDELEKIAKMRATEVATINYSANSIFQPLTVARTDEDLDKIKVAVDSVKQAADSALTFFQGLTAEVTQRLEANGVAAPLSSQVAAAFANKSSIPAEIQTAQNSSKFADAANTYVTFLKDNHRSWTRKPDGNITFKDKEALTKAQELNKAFNESAIQAGFQLK